MRPRLFWKLGLTYLALLLLIAGTLVFYTARLLERNILRSGYRQLDSLEHLSEGHPPPIDDPGALQKWADWMASSGARVTVVELRGKVLADSHEDPSRMENHAGRPEIRQALSEGRGRASRYSDTLNRELVYLAVRHRPSSGEPVILRFSLPRERINEEIGSVLGPVTLMAAFVLAIGTMVSFVFARSFSRRVERLKKLSRRVADGDFGPEPVEREGDELVELTRALNETASRLHGTIKALEAERDQSAAILSSMSEGVVVTDGEERIVFCNDAFRRSLEIEAPRSAIEGRPLIEATRHAELRAFVQAALRGQHPIRQEITVGTGQPRHFLVRAAPVGSEERLGAILVLLDITELRRLERVRRDFVANVSHELKTPLTAIQGFAETLLGGAMEDDPENSRRFITIVRDHAVRLGQLTEDLLKLSRIEAGKLELERKSFSVSDLIDPCIETTRLKAGPKGIDLTAECPKGLPRLQGDVRWMREVLQNLLDNAVQYTPSGGRIRVHSENRNGEVHIHVTDTGIGIPLGEQERIFERFYRVDPARSRQVGGTGLGLAIAKHLVEVHGGRIDVESTVGHGSTFTIVLPAEKTE